MEDAQKLLPKCRCLEVLIVLVLILDIQTYAQLKVKTHVNFYRTGALIKLFKNIKKAHLVLRGTY